MTTITRRGCAGAMVLIIAACNRANGDDATQIAALMRATWDRPDAPLDAGPIVVERDYAIADWTQGDIGGRALLHREAAAGWKVILCAGDGIRNEAGLVAVGVPAATARALAGALQRAEQAAPVPRLQRMSAFQDVVRMEGH